MRSRIVPRIALLSPPRVILPGMAKNATLVDMDRAWLHPFTSIAEQAERPAPVLVRGEGVHVEAADGRRYLDAMAGLWCVNVGYGREEIVQAIADQARRLPFAHGFAGMSHEPAVRLAALIKLIWYYNNLRGRPEKKTILSRRRAYHGVTIGASSATGLPFVHKGFDLPLDRFVHVTPPYLYREAEPGTTEAEFVDHLARELEETIEREGPGNVAAFFAEPVMGAGGVLVPPEGYFEAIVPILRRHEILLVADEVICGFGRLGSWFGSHHFGIAPDLMTLAKGLTSAYVPMSACVISDEIVSVLEEHSSDAGPFAHGYTYSGHPVAAAAALANIEILERGKLVDNAARVGAVLQAELRAKLDGHPLVGEIRGVGMIAGVEVVADPGSRAPFDAAVRVGPRLARHLLEEGVLVRTLGDTVALSPPLILDPSHVEVLTAMLGRGLDRLSAELRAEGIRFG
jgi:adenosylmethionine-8-amino-7-oxononanoate aminotransferase